MSFTILYLIVRSHHWSHTAHPLNDSVSFSICAYYVSGSVNDLEEKATGWLPQPSEPPYGCVEGCEEGSGFIQFELKKSWFSIQDREDFRTRHCLHNFHYCVDGVMFLYRWDLHKSWSSLHVRLPLWNWSFEQFNLYFILDFELTFLVSF